MAKVTVATFNCENLFARFNFNKNVDPADATKDGFTINELNFTLLDDAEKKITGQAIKALDADVLALQEVENLEVLRRFRTRRLSTLGYTHAMLVDGNDPRQIDVAVLSRHPIVAVRSYHHLRNNNTDLFSRDCLEVDIEVGSKRLTLFVNHLKSMLDKNDPKNGRKNTRAKRVLQSKTVKEIVTDRFGSSPGQHPWVVLGDLNDFLEPAQGTTTGIDGLVKWNQVENVLDRLAEGERWTHFFSGAPAGEEKFRQLDYLLLSKSLAGKTKVLPTVERRGLSTKATKATVKRFAGVTDTVSASDHCPLAIELTL